MTRARLFSRSTHPPSLTARLRTLLVSVALGVGVSVTLPVHGRGQEGPIADGEGPVVEAVATATSAPSVFLDCQGRIPCDRNQFRTEIRFVNWVRDRADSDVHVIVTSESVGGGGQRFTFDFIGQGAMAGATTQLSYTSSGTDVSAETVDGLTQILRVGLVPYAAQAGMAADFDVRYTGSLAGSEGGAALASLESGGAAVDDPWNHWTFRAGLSGDMSLGENRTNTRVNPSFSASRVTEGWKVSFSTSVDFRRDGRTLSDGRVVRNDRDDWRGNALVVKSVSSHLSTGVRVGARNSISNNQHARLSIAPAVEWNYYPYAEANRRQLIAEYSAGIEHSNYREETIFGVLQETVPEHQISLQYNAREQWGNGSVGVDASQYLHDRSLYRLGIRGSVSYRIVRGLDLNLSTNLSWVEDNMHTPASEISDEDILLGRQNLPSSYQYSASIGFGYRWGSAFTNIVNTRFGGGGGPGF